MSSIAAAQSLAAIHREYGRPDIHISASEVESPYIPWQPNVYIRHLAFDVRSGLFANVLWITKDGVLGRHRHRGPVSACVLEGSWRYLEHDWVAHTGSYVHESPGVIHTLVSDDPNGMKTMFWVNGSVEFFDETDNLMDTVDVFWCIDNYLNYCREHGLKPNPKLWI